MEENERGPAITFHSVDSFAVALLRRYSALFQLFQPPMRNRRAISPGVRVVWRRRLTWDMLGPQPRARRLRHPRFPAHPRRVEPPTRQVRPRRPRRPPRSPLHEQTLAWRVASVVPRLQRAAGASLSGRQVSTAAVYSRLDVEAFEPGDLFLPGVVRHKDSCSDGQRRRHVDIKVSTHHLSPRPKETTVLLSATTRPP